MSETIAIVCVVFLLIFSGFCISTEISDKKIEKLDNKIILLENNYTKVEIKDKNKFTAKFNNVDVEGAVLDGKILVSK